MKGQQGDEDQPVPTWRIPLVRPSLPPLDAYARALEPVWRSRMLSNFGEQAQQLERRVRDLVGSDHVLSVSSCDVGLTLAVAALGVPAGAEVLLPSFTFNSTVNAMLWNGLRPVFVDVAPGTYCLDPEAVAAALTPETGLIVATHVFGVACDVRALDAVGARHGVPVLYDAAQALATSVDGVHVGSFGDASVFSMSGTKVVTAGEGGIAVLRSAETASAFAHLRSYGFLHDYVSRYVGLNGKLSELHAALGSLTLATLEDQVAARTRLVGLYRELLAGTAVGFQAVPAGVRSSLTYLAVEVAERDRVVAALERAGIQSKAYFRPLHLMPMFAAERGSLPVTEGLAARVLCLPLFADLAEADVEAVCTAVADALAGSVRAG